MFKKGYKQTEEHKKKIADAQRGVLRPNQTGEKHQFFGKHHTKEAKQKIGLASLGRKASKETKKKMSETAKRIGSGMRLFHGIGETHPNWKGGITPERIKIWHSEEYRFWRTSVFQRDDYMCVNCHMRGGQLNADHIKPFCLFPELRFEISNGRTLCIQCHREVGWSLFKEKNPRKVAYQNLAIRLT